MKQSLIALLTVLLVQTSPAQPARSQDLTLPPPDAQEEGFDLMEEGAKLLFRGLMSKMEPALDDMGLALREMEPAFRELMTMIGDVRNYHAPEVLPNGDILIRRKTPGEVDPLPEGEIEL